MTNAREPDGTLDLRDLEERWAKVELVRSSALRAVDSWDERVVCPRSVDDVQVAGHRAYAAAGRYLTIADENHEALVSLLQHSGATPTAPWNLLRPSFEASFYALWLLAPEASLHRRRRGLQLEWLDDEAARKYGELFRTHPDLGDVITDAELRQQEVTSRRNTQIYASEADRIGLSYRPGRDERGRRIAPKPPRVNVALELGSLLDDPAMGVNLKATWSTLSGIQHAEGSAMLRVTDQRQTGAYRGGQELHMTINDEAWYLAALATSLLRTLAWSRYGECHRPARSNDAIDLAAFLRRLTPRTRGGV